MKLFLLACLILPVTLFADGGLPNQPYLYVEGHGTTEKPADLVTLRFDLSTLDAHQAEANQQVQKEAGGVLALCHAAGVADEDIVAGDLMAAEEFEWEEGVSHHGKFIGYRVTRPFEVRLRQVTKLAKLVDDLLGMGVHEFSSIAAGLSNESELTEGVWEKAVGDARARAERTARAAGEKIDSIFAISPVAIPDIRRTILGGDFDAPAAIGEADAGKPDPSHYRLPPVAISQSVHIIFLISPIK